jgi:protoporphyrinogen oxidase
MMCRRCSHRPNQTTPLAALLRQVRDGLERAGIFRRDDEVVVADVRDIRYAYVLFDKHHARVLPALLCELERRGIYSIGRVRTVGTYINGGCDGQGKTLAERWRAERRPLLLTLETPSDSLNVEGAHMR